MSLLLLLLPLPLVEQHHGCDSVHACGTHFT
jgi:hypothetical protein